MARETAHSMLRRCRGWDYRAPAIYMITLTLADRRSCALGRLVDDGARPPRVEPSPLGAAVLAHWKRMGEFTPGVEPLFGIVMPDHFHGILRVTQYLEKPLGNAIGGFKGGTTGIYRKLALPALESRKLALPAQDKGPGCASANPAAFSSAGGGDSLPAACPMPSVRNGGGDGGGKGGAAPCPVLGAQAPSLWSPGFNDRILLHAGQLAAMFDYLRDNPRRLAVRRRNPDLFRVLRDLPLDLGFPAHFAAIGNDALLRAPVLLQVQCSRSLLPGGREFEELRAGFIAAAQHGAVLVSPCISRGEREIVRSALVCGGAAIALKNKGFPDVYKPGGRLFDRCADGKLLLLAPAAWPYTPAEKPMTRLDACALNRIAQLISRDGAAAIDYRGMAPANVDALARAACTRRGG